MEEAPLINNSYFPPTPVYEIIKPEIKSGAIYYFTSDSGLTYQVTFGRKKKNYLENIINFSVLSDEYEDEYSETNKGEVWRIIATMTEIVRIYHSNHPFSWSYQFSGEFKNNESKTSSSIRTRLFLRTIMRVLDFRFWEVRLEENKVSVVRRNKNE